MTRWFYGLSMTFWPLCPVCERITIVAWCSWSAQIILKHLKTLQIIKVASFLLAMQEGVQEFMMTALTNLAIPYAARTKILMFNDHSWVTSPKKPLASPSTISVAFQQRNQLRAVAIFSNGQSTLLHLIMVVRHDRRRPRGGYWSLARFCSVVNTSPKFMIVMIDDAGPSST